MALKNYYFFKCLNFTEKENMYRENTTHVFSSVHGLDIHQKKDVRAMRSVIAYKE